MARYHKGRKMREFSYLNDRYINKNYLKYYKHAVRDICGGTDLTMNEVNVMLFMYDYEFFTANHMADALFQSRIKFKQKVLYPLMKRKWVHKVFDREKVGEMTWSQALMHERGKYRNRYALTQNARLVVQKFYRKLEGDEAITIPD
jgi:acetone carboxylase gamma subunit